MDVGISEATQEVVVRIAGEAGYRLADPLTAALLRLTAGPPKLVTLDLSELTFICSLAMGVLVSFRRGVIRRGGRVRLGTTLQEPVREALDRAGLLGLFASAGPA
jgi:anti-anti-sigma factor